MVNPVPGSPDMSSTPGFAGQERRSLLLPIILALAVLAAALGVWAHLFPTSTVRVEHVHTELVPTHTVFKSNSIVVGPTQAQDDLYVVTTLRINNQLRVPVSVDDITCTLTDQDGAELTVSAADKQDLANIELSFPQLKPLLTTPFERESTVEAGKTMQGAILLHFALPRGVWDARKSAVVKVDLYHQQSLSVTIPKDAGR